MKPIIYLDMDGVLSDIEHGIQERYGFVDLENERSWFFKSFLPNYVEVKGFENEKPCDNADRLIEELFPYHEDDVITLSILTSAGQFYEPVSEVIHQKKKFLEKNFPQLNNIPFCVTSSGAHKAHFAHSNAFLIDDHTKNCNRFIDSGGYAYHYKPNKIDKALRVVNEWIDERYN